MNTGRRVSRRAALGLGTAAVIGLGAGSVALVETGTVPGRGPLHRAIGRRPPSAPSPTAAAGPTRTGAFVSAARLGATTAWRATWPPGHEIGAPLPVLIVLHGFDATNEAAFAALHLDQHLAAVVAAGSAPFAIAAADGGNGYWHPRADFGDAGAMVTDEFLPRLAALGLRTESVGLLGWSMGGYGALLLGAQLGPERVPVVVAESPALWTSSARRNPTAFDDDADYRAHDVWAGRVRLRDTAVRIDCGVDDAFCPAVRSFVRGMDPRPAGEFTAGAHDDAFWSRMAPSQLQFVAAHLA